MSDKDFRREFFGEIDPEHEQKKKLEKTKQGIQRHNEIADFKKILAMPEGRRFLWRMLEIAKPFHNPAVIENVNATYFNCGKRVLGDLIYNEIMEIAPTQFEKMMREQKSRKELEKNGN